MAESTTKTPTTEPAPPDPRARLRAVWASGDYPALARTVIPRLGERVVEAAAVQPGERVLDVAAGSGNAAIPAAERGAHVTASDLTPELFVAGRAEASARGVELAWEEGDAAALPHGDATFDVVLSCVGVMFAPHHQAAADEVVRVLRPGGRLSVLSWTPQGFIGRMFATMRPYAPPPPPGASPPPAWGSEDHVRELFSDRVRDLQATTGHAPVDAFGSGADFRDYFKATYGPTIAVYRSLAAEPARAAELDAALAALGDEALVDGLMHWEYLLVTAVRA